MDKPKIDTPTVWTWVKALSMLMLVGVVTYKIYVTPIELKVDFPVLLSLMLAIFSVGLAALFYFKATETSNTFYDNTYNFTRDIAQLLSKMESGFGERLRHLDEGYSSMRDYLQTMPKSSADVEETKKKIASEKQEIEKVVSERNQIVQQLLERSQLHKEEKEKIAAELQQKEKALEEAQKDFSKMNRRLFLERFKRRELIDPDLDDGFSQYTLREVIPMIGGHQIRNVAPSTIRRRFKQIADKLPSRFIEDMEDRGYYSEGLTRMGANFLRELAVKGDV